MTPVGIVSGVTRALSLSSPGALHLSSPGLTGRSSIHHHRRNEHWSDLSGLHLRSISHRGGYWVARSSRAMTPVGMVSGDDTGGDRLGRHPGTLFVVARRTPLVVARLDRAIQYSPPSPE